LIGFAPLCHMAAGARLTPIQLMLNILDGQFHSRRTTIHHAADCRAMTLAE